MKHLEKMRSARLMTLTSLQRVGQNLHVTKVLINHRCYTGKGCETSLQSHLYLPNWKANETVSVLTPHFEFDPSPEGLEAMKHNLVSRKMKPVDLTLMAQQWLQREDLLSKKNKVEASKDALIQTINEKMSSGANDDTLKPLFGEGRHLRHLLKGVSRELDRLEESLMPRLLQLPNHLNPATPHEGPKVVRRHFEIPRFDFSPLSHVTIGRRTDTFRLTSVGPAAYYLQGKGGLLELATLDYFAERFRQAGFTRFSNPDFCKPIVVEGCGLDFTDPSVTYHLENTGEPSESEMTDLHLLGGASFPVFCAYHVKTRVNHTDLPLQYFTTGRHYKPCSFISEDLFNTSQASVLKFFVAVDRNNSEIYQKYLEMIESALIDLECHFRIVEVPAPSLQSSEDRKTDFEMWSVSKERYQRIATLSSVSDYISKRLRMFYKDSDQLHYLHVLHGTAISFPEFLACLMENNQAKDGNFSIPQNLANYLSVYE